MAFASLSQCCQSANAARPVRRIGASSKARGRSIAAVSTEAAPPQARVFTDEEWQQAGKEASRLAVAYAQASATAASASSSAQSSAVVLPEGRSFSDADWDTAFQLAASQNPLLYNSVSASGDAASVADVTEESSSYPVFPAAPAGRVFSDEEWEYGFSLAAKGPEALVPAVASEFPPPPEGRVFSDEAWQDALTRSSSGKLEDVEEPVPQSFSAVMAFRGAGPETINGRLAMFGFFTALASELGSAKSVAAQYAEASGGVQAAVLVLSVASLIPMLKGVGAKSIGPFTVKAEQLNGKAAMVGFAAILLIEGAKGSALF